MRFLIGILVIASCMCIGLPSFNYFRSPEKLVLKFVSAQSAGGQKECVGPTKNISLVAHKDRFKLGRSNIAIKGNTLREKQRSCTFTYSIVRRSKDA